MSASNHHDEHILTIHKLYNTFGYTPPHSQFTILAAFYLTHPESGNSKIISLGTGTKCIPLSKLSDRGEMVHDSHAEVLARRGASMWFLEEIRKKALENGMKADHASRCSARKASPSLDSTPAFDWIIPSDSSNKIFRLADGVEVNLYISTLPCGDASMRYLASIQDEEMAALKDSSPSPFPVLASTAASRGRDDYSRLGVLRTKPGRADSPATHYLPDGYRLNKPNILFTDVPFLHSKSILKSESSSNEAICWVDDGKPHEVLINGLKRGVSPKHRYREKSRPKLSSLAKLILFLHTREALQLDPLPADVRYLETKLLSKAYNSCKQTLLGPSGPFSGWLSTDQRYRLFNAQKDDSTDTGSNTSPPMPTVS